MWVYVPVTLFLCLLQVLLLRDVRRGQDSKSMDTKA
jgi:hypothetical protein